MAKSAIRAGIEILMEEYGCTATEISKVYLAGGFGVHLLEEDAIVTGILPEEFRGKTQSIGNGALKGSIQYGLAYNKRWNSDETELETESGRMKAVENVKEIIKRTTNISLAEEQKFQEKYMKFMEFGVR